MTPPGIMLLQFLMEDFLRLSPWSYSLGQFERKKKLYYRTLYFFLRIMKFLQLHGRKQIAKSRKYYLVCDYLSLRYIFSSIFTFHWSENFVHISIIYRC